MFTSTLHQLWRCFTSYPGNTAAGYTSETARQAKDYTLQKATEGKEAALSTGQTTSQYARDTVVAGKDSTIEVGKRGAGYAGEKATLAKDTTVETAKAVAGYAEKLALDVKEKAVEATKVAAEKVKGVAGFGGEKKEEKKKEAETEKVGEALVVLEEEYGPEGKVREEGVILVADEEENAETVKSGGVLNAIGETIVELAQTAKEMVLGPDDEPVALERALEGYEIISTPTMKQAEESDASVGGVSVESGGHAYT